MPHPYRVTFSVPNFGQTLFQENKMQKDNRSFTVFINQGIALAFGVEAQARTVTNNFEYPEEMALQAAVRTRLEGTRAYFERRTLKIALGAPDNEGKTAINVLEPHHLAGPAGWIAPVLGM